MKESNDLDWLDSKDSNDEGEEVTAPDIDLSNEVTEEVTDKPDEEAVDVPTEEVSDAEDSDAEDTEAVAEVSARQFVLEEIESELFRRFHDRVLAKEVSSSIYEITVEAMFTAIAECGYLRLPSGYGSFVAELRKATRRRIPATKELKEFPARRIVKYREGRTARALANENTQ